MVIASGSTLMDLPGIGPIGAARILADVGDVSRFADRNRFASWTGTAPLDASSGEQIRHRLSRAGNRKINHMLHMAAPRQIRLDTDGRAYYRRKRAAGKTHLEALRCLKRRISDAVYRQLLRRRRRNGSAGCESGRALRGVSRIQRGRPTPAHRHFGSATPGPAPTTLRRANTTAEDPNPTSTSERRLTTEGSRKDSPERECSASHA